MFELNYEALAAALLPVVLAAGSIELQHYNASVEVKTKSDNSPVTVADQEAEAIILAALAKIEPDIPVVAEEAASAGNIPQIGTRFFLVDPLDGTKEFIHQRGEFTVNIALIDEARPIFGIVYAPVMSELYVTLGPDRAAAARVTVDQSEAAQEGVLCLDNCGLMAISCRQMDMGSLTVIASRSHGNEATEAFLENYKVAERISAGSSLKFCLLARGDGDLYPRLAPTMEWDTAAGHAILAAAGGSVTMLDGTPFRYGKTEVDYLNPGFIAWGRR